MYKLSLLIIVVLFAVLNLNAQNKHAKTSKYLSYKGLAMAGYQGWFRAPGEGMLYPDEKQVKIDMWPEVSEYEKTYPTGLKLADGSTARFFSSTDKSTVDLHFKWMKQYGIDGVFMQRFFNMTKPNGSRNRTTVVLKNAFEAASKYERAIAVMYDLSGLKASGEDCSSIIEDWKYLVDSLRLTGQASKMLRKEIPVSFEIPERGKKNHLKSEWALAAYNFGSLGKLIPESQIDLLNKIGYKGIILSCETKSDFQNLDKYIEKAAKMKDFKIEAVFERYNFNDSTERRERWRKVVDKIAGKETKLWIIFGKKVEGITDDFIETKLCEIVSYSAQKGVSVVLYPHSKCYIASAEEALPFIEKIDHPNLKLAVHLCHEIRAGNGARMNQVFDRVKDRIGAITLAGTDSVADFSAPKLMDSSTIKPLGEGNFDLTRFVEPLSQSGYKGLVGFINFKIEEDPETYLDASLKVWRRLQEKSKE